MQGIRLVMVGLCSPILVNTGYGLSKKEFVVLVWGGLRGSLALTMALMIGVDNEIKNTKFKDLTVFYVAGCSTLSMFFNA